MVVIKRFDTTLKPTFKVTIAMKSKITNVPVILDTGATKPLWFGTLEELLNTGAIHIDDTGSYQSANGTVNEGCPIYRINLRVRSDIGGIGFNLYNVDILLVNKKGIDRKKYKMLLPYTLLNKFNLCLYSAKHTSKFIDQFKLKDFYKFGYIAINTLENVINYNVKSANGTPIEIHELCKDEEVLDID